MYNVGFNPTLEKDFELLLFVLSGILLFVSSGHGSGMMLLARY